MRRVVLVILIVLFMQLSSGPQISVALRISDSEGQKCRKVGLLSSDNWGNDLVCRRVSGKRIWQYDETNQSAIPATNLKVKRTWLASSTASNFLFTWDSLENWDTQFGTLIYWNATFPTYQYKYPVTNAKTVAFDFQSIQPICFTILSEVKVSGATTLANAACEDATTVFTTTSTTTTTIPLTKPNAPSKIALNNFDPALGTATLSWQDNSTNESGFYITDKAVAAGTPLSSIWQNVAANTTSLKVTGLKSGYKYCFDIFAANSAGVSNWSGNTCFTTGNTASSISNSTTTTTSTTSPMPTLSFSENRYGSGTCSLFSANLNMSSVFQCPGSSWLTLYGQPQKIYSFPAIFKRAYEWNGTNVSCSWDSWWLLYFCRK